jgi:hypothetical protein
MFIGAPPKAQKAEINIGHYNTNLEALQSYKSHKAITLLMRYVLNFLKITFINNEFERPKF